MPNFEEPIDRTSINGFPIRFRKDVIRDDLVLYVPQRITRNRQSKGWRIIINHAHGVVRLWEPDQGRFELDSLNSAWHRLVEQLEQLETPITKARRRINPGRKRNPLTDTGVDGVLISRQKAKNSRSANVSVVMTQRMKDPEKTSKGVTVVAFCISERVYRESPQMAQKRFRRALCEAIAIRQRYLEVYSQTGPVPEPIYLADIDPKTIPAKPVREPDLGAIFASIKPKVAVEVV